MQDVPLTLDVVLHRCRETGANVEVVSVTPAGPVRTTWGEIGRRATALAGVLDELGVAPGVPCAGRVAQRPGRGAAPETEPVQRALSDAAAWICYTSGTTGLPKGVVSSHLACLFHSMSSTAVDSHAVSREDVLLAVTPLFHVNARGLTYTTALIEAERVTVAAAVPTV